MKFFKELLGGEVEEKPRPPRGMLPAEAPPLGFREGTTLPIVDWEAMDPHAPPTVDKSELDAFWTLLAHKWLEALGAALGKEYAIRDSEHFLLLSALDPRGANAALGIVERA